MKLSINRYLLEVLIDKVSNALDKAVDQPNAPGKYITLEVNDKTLYAYVLRPEISAIGWIDKDKLGAKAALMTVEKPGSCRIDGEMLQKAIGGCAVEGDLTLEFKENPNRADEDEVSGTLLVTFSPGGADSEFFGLQSTAAFERSKLTISDKYALTIDGSCLSERTKEVGVAAGKMSMSEEFANVLIRNTDLDVEMVTTNGLQIALSKFKAKEKSSDINCCLPYDLFAMGMKMCDEDQDIHIQTSSSKLILTQNMNFAAGLIGQIKVFVSTSSVSFPQFAKKLSKLDLKHNCKVRKADFEVCCKKLDVVSMLKASVTYDPEKKELTFSKKDERGFSKTVLPLIEADGSRLDMEFSSLRFKEGVKFCSATEPMEIKFSGRMSLAVMIPNPNLYLYFTPYVGA